MERGVQKGRRKRGGILSLVRTIQEHDRALEYDLMTRTGRTLSEYEDMGAGGRLALVSFISYLPPDSAYRTETEPDNEYREWFTTLKTNKILADLFDVTVASHTPKGRKVKEYPRPKDKKKIGRGAVPISEFWDWWNSKG